MFNLPFFGKKQELFGLDIGSAMVKAVQLRESGPSYALAALGMAPVAPDAISDGSIKDPPAVIDAVKDAVAKAGLKTTDIAISVCGRELIIKKVQIPEVPPKELHGAVLLEAEHHIPFAADEVYIDYHVVGTQGGQMDLILVAVKKSKVAEYVSVAEEAGLNPVIVDVDGFALGNQFELNTPEPGTDAVALIDIGASVMKTNVIHGGATIFARDIPFGGNNYTQAIAQRLRISFDEAEAAKIGKDVGVKWEAIVPALEEVSRELSLEVQRTFDYFSSTAESERIGKIVLAGGCAQLPGLNEYLSSTWGIAVEMARPLDRVEVPPAHAEEVAAAGPALAVAVGLGLRRAGDKGK
ncbi:MAG: type IV pilus assembly protein PilM [Candidatus Rokubacteria bacterium]|nr:type IV pilus assembly protein PilM [Candidatus Rokubacteria bacterium]